MSIIKLESLSNFLNLYYKVDYKNIVETIDVIDIYKFL
jgi:hypothetical protein